MAVPFEHGDPGQQRALDALPVLARHRVLRLQGLDLAEQLGLGVGDGARGGLLGARAHRLQLAFHGLDLGGQVPLERLGALAHHVGLGPELVRLRPRPVGRQVALDLQRGDLVLEVRDAPPVQVPGLLVRRRGGRFGPFRRLLDLDLELLHQAVLGREEGSQRSQVTLGLVVLPAQLLVPLLQSFHGPSPAL